MADEGALDPFAAIEAKYGAGLSEKMEARDVLARQLEVLGPEYSSELALLKADYEKAKAASEIEQQLSLSCKIEELQVACGSYVAQMLVRPRVQLYSCSAPHDHTVMDAAISCLTCSPSSIVCSG